MLETKRVLPTFCSVGVVSASAKDDGALLAHRLVGALLPLGAGAGVERGAFEEPAEAVAEFQAKLRLAGFRDCIDTEDMFFEWFRELQRLKVLPPPRQGGGAAASSKL